MRVILTHTNADFDAIASLLAMHKLEPAAVPILPKYINHNVEQFLLLYASALSALRRDDIPSRTKIEQVYVVDTQKFNMVRGMDRHTPVHIIDHHERKDDLPDHHEFEGETVGANTTLLVEMLLERNLHQLSHLEATLLMLGIYEDTGSLSYGSTTPRDIRAAAWLLEKNANLDVVRQFLQHPLNEAQQKLYDRLADTAITMNIHGYQVTLTSATLDVRVDEMATLAHKLRELFESDALFITVEIKEGVQVIARSITDNVDVGTIVRHLGGGGHPRAAAVLVRDQSLTTVLCDIIELLESSVTPSVRVADMMSLNVQAFQKNDPIGKVYEAMLESGHDGYPVLEGKKLVGLVTRRAVDRAMRHHMQNNKITEVLETGQEFVTPADTIETLKDRILDSGWGQMPVLDEDGYIIGIVTRTDLIKQWGRRSLDQHRRQDMRQRLQDALPNSLWKLLELISLQAAQQHDALFIVGGIVRDLLLERPNLDIDLVVEGDAIALGKAMQQHYGGSLHTHRQFGTAKWKLDQQVADTIGFPDALHELPPTIDFATSRAEFYEAPTVLPTVRRSSIKLDLHRRDFTINTLAIRLAPPPIGDLLDFYKGEEDLREGVIRVLHSLSFVDDPTRILRAVRFEQRFGFTIEKRTEERIEAALPLIERVSGDRIRHELNLILAEEQALQGLQRLEELNILPTIFPNLKLHAETEMYFQILASIKNNPPIELPDDYDDWRVAAFSLLTYHLSEGQIEKLGRRLLAARRTVDQLQAVRKGYHLLNMLSSMQISDIVAALEPLSWSAWLALWIMADDPTRAIIEQFVAQWRHITPTLTGKDLMQMGMPAGPAIGRALRELRLAWLNGQIKDEQDEQSYAQYLIQTPASDQ